MFLYIQLVFAVFEIENKRNNFSHALFFNEITRKKKRKSREIISLVFKQEKNEKKEKTREHFSCC